MINARICCQTRYICRINWVHLVHFTTCQSSDLAGLISPVSLGRRELLSLIVVVAIGEVSVIESVCSRAAGRRCGSDWLNLMPPLTRSPIFISESQKGGQRGGMKGGGIRRLIHEPVINAVTLSLWCFVLAAPRLLGASVHHPLADE